MNRFLLIDDDDIFNFLNKKVLEKSGQSHAITVHTSAREGLDYLSGIMGSDEKWPQIILLDIRMPGMDGFEFLDVLKNMDEKFLKQVKVFMLTSSIDDRDKRKSEIFPFVYGYYSKPLSPSILLHMEELPLRNYDAV